MFLATLVERSRHGATMGDMSATGQCNYRIGALRRGEGFVDGVGGGNREFHRN